MEKEGTVLVAARLTVACADRDTLFDAALAAATRDGVAANAYRQARAMAADAPSFDVETLLSHAMRGGGCTIRDFAVEGVTVEPARKGHDDLMHVERTGSRTGRKHG